MKKIFYSMMAVALCACSQSEVEDMPIPQPENNGLKFTVVDNGFVNEDGTRVQYGEFGTADAYTATFEEGNQIGVYAIKTMGEDKTPATYGFMNEPLTLGADGVWRSANALDLTNVKVLFAYAPYRADASVTDDYKPLFTGADGSWEVDNTNNRNGFFVGGNLYKITDNSGDNFELNDWMGAAVNLTGDETAITFNMEHMREMIELTTHKDAQLDDLTLAIGTAETADKYKFTPYHVNANDPDRKINIYRILTTEYRSTNVVYATVTYNNEQKKYKKTLSGNGAGKCFWVNISHSAITVGSENLSAILTREYGTNYATNPELMSLRLEGELQEGDWTTLGSLAHLKSLNMSALTNKSIPVDWMKNATALKKTLTTLILPNGLTTIGSDALQAEKVAHIDIPATVTEIGTGAFYWCPNMTIRIPEGSQLKTVGNGVFYNTKAVYTYENNLHVLVLPETLTNIGIDGAFNAINQLSKIVFKGATPPTIQQGGKIDPFTPNAVIYVPNTDYKNKGLFPGNTVYVGPALTAGNYSAIDKDGFSLTSAWEGTLSALCDGPANTYWHSDYQYYHNYDKWGIYIDITLPKAYSNLKLSYTNRDSNQQLLKEVIIGVATDNGDFTEIGKYTQTTGPAETGEFDITLPASVTSYNKVRFGVTNSVAGGEAFGDSKAVWTSLSELTVYEEKWTE